MKKPKTKEIAKAKGIIDKACSLHSKKLCALSLRLKETGKLFHPNLHFSYIDAMVSGNAVMVGLPGFQYVIVVPSTVQFGDLLKWTKEVKPVI